jgi:hypothetical protein
MVRLSRSATLYVGSPQSKEGDDRMEAKIDAILAAVDPKNADTVIDEDDEALLTDKALKPSHWQSFMSTAGLVSVIASAIAGVFAGVVARAVAGSTVTIAVVLGIAIFVANVALMRRYHVRSWRAAEQRMAVLFPSTPDHHQ